MEEVYFGLCIGQLSRMLSKHMRVLGMEGRLGYISKVKLSP
jgi:hypothetical protein